MPTKELTTSTDELCMKARIDALLADLVRMSDELEARNEETRQWIARTDELLARWSREQAASDMGVKV